MNAIIRIASILALAVFAAPVARAAPPDALQSVVSVLPVWPNQPQGGGAARPGTAPEGSGVAIAPDLIATAWHVIAPAERIDIRLADGRILPGQLVAADEATDIAILSVDAVLPPIVLAESVAPFDTACAIGNAFGLGLSVTCGVVSATDVSNAGFNAVEDFVQTDAAINPGMSGGALVDVNGQLVGLISAIFASGTDTNIGVNFAVSTRLLTRVTDALLSEGEVRFPDPGWRLSRADAETLTRIASPVIAAIAPDGPAASAGLQAGDLLIDVGGRRTLTPRDAITALALLPQDADGFPVTFERDGVVDTLRVALTPAAPTPQEKSRDTPVASDCPHAAQICEIRQAVFPVSSFDPVGSATRIGPDLLVTNRHVVGDRMGATVFTPDGPRDARVVPSAYPGDLVLLAVDGLPDQGLIPELSTTIPADSRVFTIGADIARQVVRVFAPGEQIAPPMDGADLARLHVDATMQPGVSGGALVTEDGGVAGIAVGGGDRRFEAIPARDIARLLALRDDANAQEITRQLGQDFASCAALIDTGAAEDDLVATCEAADNHGQLLEAGRLLARLGDFDGAARLHAAAVRQVPNSINARVSLLVSLQLGARFNDMLPHARHVMGLAPDDPQVLRFAIQSGVWGGDPDLAEEGYAALLQADPVQAQAARRFIDNAPPAPQRR